MLKETISIRATFLIIYLMAKFGFRICKETLVDSCCISSISLFNCFVTLLSWVILSLLKKSIRLTTSPPVSFQSRLVTALFQSLNFLFVTKSVSVNTFSFHRFAHSLSIPYGLMVSYFFLSRRFSAITIIAIAIFYFGSFIISTDSFSMTPFGLCIGFLSSIFTAHLAIYIEEVIMNSGASAIALQGSVAGLRFIFSIIFLIFEIVVEQEQFEISIQSSIYAFCLIFAAAALDLTITVSMISLITYSSAISFLVAEQLCEILMILIGQTLNPTQFTTLEESISSFLGFALAIPGQVLFVVAGDSFDWKPNDIEPFHLSPITKNDSQGDSEVLIE